MHRRLGARVWEAESCAALAALGAPGDHAEQAGLLAAQLGLPGVAARLAGSLPRTRSCGGTASCGWSATGAAWRTCAISRAWPTSRC